MQQEQSAGGWVLIQKVHSCGLASLNFPQVVWKRTLHLNPINVTITRKVICNYLINSY